MTTIQERVLHTVKETAAILRVHQQTVYREIWRGNLGSERVGGKILISDDHLAAYSEANSRPAQQRPDTAA